MPSPTSVPSNVRNGRLFAGAHAPLPRFLPLLAGTSFNGYGIEPESCAANGGVREGAATGSETQHPAIASESGFKPPHYRLERKKNNRKPARPEREAGKGVRRRGQTACCLPSPPQPKRRVFLRRKGLILLRPLSAGRRLFPRKRHADGFGATFCHQKAATLRGRKPRKTFLGEKSLFGPRFRAGEIGFFY